MSRPIDADALKELFSEVIGRIAIKPEMNGNLEHMIRASAMVIQMIDDAPTVQPDIIRCKDCIYQTESWSGIKYCEAHGDHIGKDYDYCSNARRKENGH